MSMSTEVEVRMREMEHLPGTARGVNLAIESDSTGRTVVTVSAQGVPLGGVRSLLEDIAEIIGKGHSKVPEVKPRGFNPQPMEAKR